MQCPRCYYTNAEGTRVCEYCGGQLDGGTDPSVGGGGPASSKRKTMLGPAPTAQRSSPPPPLNTPRIDPRDPFKIAAEGIRDGPPLPHVAAPPAASSSANPSPAKAARRPRPTMIVGGSTSAASSPLAGVALVIPAEGAARSVILREGRTRIGRRQDLEISVQDPKASTEHALLRLESGEAWLLDTSANGTHVAGQLCLNDRATVTDGTVLRIGDTAIVLKLLAPECLAQIAADDG